VAIGGDHPTGGPVTLALRPERLIIHGKAEQVALGRNRLAAKVARRTYYGDVYYYEVDAGLDEPLEVKEENRPDLEIHEVGEQVVVSWHPEGANLVSD
jgi:ABC-type Fe3+/spermidine/putrescine transport system ATPase subunit